MVGLELHNEGREIGGIHADFAKMFSKPINIIHASDAVIRMEKIIRISG